MILIVEDDIVMGECLARMCRPNATKVIGDAGSALDYLREGELPELIFLDLLLPGCNGLDLMNELVSYADTSTISVVLVSSLAVDWRALEDYDFLAVIEKEKINTGMVQELIKRVKNEKR